MNHSKITVRQALAAGRLSLTPGDCLILLQQATRQSKAFLYAHPEAALRARQWQAYQHGLSRRRAGEPIAYIIQQKEFWSLPFKVTPGVLIPRPETESVVQTALQTIHRRHYQSVLDLGAGSGCIAIALGKECSNLNLTAIDISATCLGIGKYNARRLGVNNIRFIRSHWFNAVKNKKFDLIVSNPPYIAANDQDLESQIEKYEPDIALFSAHNGLADLYQIIENAPHYLRQQGALIVEHGYLQGPAVRTHFSRQGYVNIHTIKDLQQHERVTLGYI